MVLMIKLLLPVFKGWQFLIINKRVQGWYYSALYAALGPIFYSFILCAMKQADPEAHGIKIKLRLHLD